MEWSFHEPYSGVYNFEEQADIEHFLTISKQENMMVLIRPGPFISAERDFVSTYSLYSICINTLICTQYDRMLNL